MFTQQKTHAMTLIALMMLAALAGCLGGDDTTDTDTDPVDTGGTDPVDNGTDNTTTVDNGTDPATNQTTPSAIVCGPDGPISIAGSSTVYPLATRRLREY